MTTKKYNKSAKYSIDFDRSFSSSDKVKNWSEKNNKSPRDVFLGSSSTYLFLCERCNHEFSASPGNILAGKWCPFCSNPPKRLCNYASCKFCFTKSFASSSRSQYWSSKNKCTPRDVFISSGKKYTFLCPCGHEFSSRLNMIQKGTWCPFCSLPPKQLCCDKNCKQCFHKSFASSDKSIYWSPKNESEPRDVFLYSHKKFVFDCYLCSGEFETNLYHLAEGKWCSKCKNKTESKLLTYLESVYQRSNYSVEHQKKFGWCRSPSSDKKLPYDFLLSSDFFIYPIIIELDGPQHFRQISNWKSPEVQHKRDVYKDLFANYYGYSVIRLLQEDVLYDRNDWRNKLDYAINMASQNFVILSLYESNIIQINYDIILNFEESTNTFKDYN